jgi:hypothetical protein
MELESYCVRQVWLLMRLKKLGMFDPGNMN